ncbi:MAG: cytochrome c family protein, partial [Pseudomonadota bacterium]
MAINYNMYAGAFLSTVFVVMTVGIVGDTVFQSDEPEQQGFAIVVEESDGGAAPAEEEEDVVAPIAPLLASADIGAGESVFRQCSSCHNVADGAGNKAGPNLWGVMGRQPGIYPDFRYSSAMVAYGEANAQWDFEAMNRFLLRPRDYIDGTSMGYRGLRDEDDRANLIAYLNAQSA